MPLRHVARACAVLLFVLLGHVTVVQAFRSRALNADPRNERPLMARYDQPRGSILTYDGTPVAVSRIDRGGPYRYRRVYPRGQEYAAITGHLSLHRSTGIERAQDGVLSGEDPKIKLRSLVKDGAAAGADVRLTIHDRVQRAAHQALAATRLAGAAVAINPATGAVLALATYPTYDPGALAEFDRERLAEVTRRLRADKAEPLLNRALDRLYPPGSTFTLVTTAAALASREYTPTAHVNAPARLRLPGTATYVRNAGDRPCGNGRPTLVYALQTACDTAFAAIGLQLGQDLLRDQAEAFGFNAADLRIPLPTTPSRYPAALNRAQTALTAIGRHETRVTPLMVAMMSAAVANNGVLMRPYLVEEVRLPDGSVVNRADPKPYRTVVPPTLAKYLALMMTTATRAGGTQVAVPGMRVAARSATLRPEPSRDPKAGRHALVTAFAPADAPEVAVGVVLEDAGERAGEVGPVARAIIEAALS